MALVDGKVKTPKSGTSSLYSCGAVIGDNWLVKKRIGVGQFSEVYHVHNVNDKREAALKIEKPDSASEMIKFERSVLKAFQGKKGSCKLYGFGSHRCPTTKSQSRYIVMELLGESISAWERRQTKGYFSSSEIVRVLLPMLGCIESFHDVGYIHRDIKPSNFARRQDHKGSHRYDCALIDFGQSKKYIDEQGNFIKAAGQARFHGTSRMASLSAHREEHLSRRDDMWSFLFIILRFSLHGLPWGNLVDRNEIQKKKSEWFEADQYPDALPSPLCRFADHLKALQYEDKPDYELCRGLIKELHVKKKTTTETEINAEEVSEATPELRHRRYSETSFPASMGKMTPDIGQREPEERPREVRRPSTGRTTPDIGRHEPKEIIPPLRRLGPSETARYMRECERQLPSDLSGIKICVKMMSRGRCEAHERNDCIFYHPQPPPPRAHFRNFCAYLKTHCEIVKGQCRFQHLSVGEREEYIRYGRLPAELPYENKRYERREEEDRRRQEEEDRKRRKEEEDRRTRKEEEERRRREEEERKRRDDEERRRRDEEDRRRRDDDYGRRYDEDHRERRGHEESRVREEEDWRRRREDENQWRRNDERHRRDEKRYISSRSHREAGYGEYGRRDRSRDRSRERSESVSRSHSFGARSRSVGRSQDENESLFHRTDRALRQGLCFWDMEGRCMKKHCQFYHPRNRPWCKGGGSPALPLCRNCSRDACSRTSQYFKDYHWSRDQLMDYVESGRVPSIREILPSPHSGDIGDRAQPAKKEMDEEIKGNDTERKEVINVEETKEKMEQPGRVEEKVEVIEGDDKEERREVDDQCKVESSSGAQSIPDQDHVVTKEDETKKSTLAREETLDRKAKESTPKDEIPKETSEKEKSTLDSVSSKHVETEPKVESTPQEKSTVDSVPSKLVETEQKVDSIAKEKSIVDSLPSKHVETEPKVEWIAREKLTVHVETEQKVDSPKRRSPRAKLHVSTTPVEVPRRASPLIKKKETEQVAEKIKSPKQKSATERTESPPRHSPRSKKKEETEQVDETVKSPKEKKRVVKKEIVKQRSETVESTANSASHPVLVTVRRTRSSSRDVEKTSPKEKISRDTVEASASTGRSNLRHRGKDEVKPEEKKKKEKQSSLQNLTRLHQERRKSEVERPAIRRRSSRPSFDSVGSEEQVEESKQEQVVMKTKRTVIRDSSGSKKRKVIERQTSSEPTESDEEVPKESKQRRSDTMGTKDPDEEKTMKVVKALTQQGRPTRKSKNVNYSEDLEDDSNSPTAKLKKRRSSERNNQQRSNSSTNKRRRRYS